MKTVQDQINELQQDIAKQLDGGSKRNDLRQTLKLMRKDQLRVENGLSKTVYRVPAISERVN